VNQQFSYITVVINLQKGTIFPNFYPKTCPKSVAKHYNSQKHTANSNQIWHNNKDQCVLCTGGPRHAFNAKMAVSCHLKSQ